MKNFLRHIFALLFLLAPLSVSANTVTDLFSRAEEIRSEIRRLTTELRTRFAESSKGFQFERNLTIGSRGEDVKRLQLFLTLYTQFYPESLITSYYGELTSSAVGRLQKEYGIEEAFFGEKTRAAMNELFSEPSAFLLSAPNSGDGVFAGKREVADEIDIEKLSKNIHEKINQIRRKEGLQELLWNDSLSEVALLHSKDQAQDNIKLTDPKILCHYPTIRHEGFTNGYLIRDRVERAKITFRSVGENIAMVPALKTRSYSLAINADAPKCPVSENSIAEKITSEESYKKDLKKLEEKALSIKQVDFIKEERYTMDEVVSLVVEGWMNSSGHRENILFPEYTHGGIGVVKVNDYYIITHDFVGR